jgi:hypothetical protein
VSKLAKVFLFLKKKIIEEEEEEEEEVLLFIACIYFLNFILLATI